jgi:D-hydroxyproline dehydrogenase subunit beta
VPRSGYDVVVVGAGILGLAHAWEARRRGRSVAVFEADARCAGASVRNFGFVTLSGQRAGDTWRRARESRDTWERVCAEARIPVLHRGAWILCRRAEALAVARAFVADPSGAQCCLYESGDFPALQKAVPGIDSLATDGAKGLLFSPHELRVESGVALPRLTQHLQEQGVDVFFGCGVQQVLNGVMLTTAGITSAERVILCTGARLQGLTGAAWRGLPLELCTLQMLRIEAAAAVRLPGSVMSDESLVRYPGWSGLPGAEALRARIAAEDPALIEHGIHLIAVQDADGSLVIGDSHHYGDAERIGVRADVEDSILRLARRVLRLEALRVRERWTGVYPSLAGTDALIRPIDQRCTAVLVTSGTGASTAFAIAREVFDSFDGGAA